MKIEDTALVLEGGGLRGVFTCGVLDCFMDHGIRFPFAVGVSAGACNGLSYMSGQRGRAKASNIDLMDEHHYVGFRYLLTQGCIMDFKLLFEDFPQKIIPYDYGAYFSNPDRFVMVTTNCLTGRAEYLEEKSDPGRVMDIVRASSSLPFVSRIIYRKYPQLQKALSERNSLYNRTMDRIENLEEEGRIVVIRPQKPVEVGRMEKDTSRLFALYDEGYAVASAALPRIRMKFNDKTFLI